MDHTYDNGEVDEMYKGQWGFAPGSFVSSEDLAGRNNVQSYVSCPSPDMTSLTSWDMHRDHGLFSTEPSGQLRELPEKCDDDLNYINPRYLPFDDIPQNLAEDLPLGNQVNDDQPSQTLMGRPSEFDRTTMGIPDPVPLSLEHSLEDAMSPVMENVTSIFKSLVHNQTCTHDQVSEGILNLDTLRSFFNSKLPMRLPSIDEGANQDKEQYMCWICEEKRTPFSLFGTFKRHLITHRIAEVEWQCRIPNCTKIFFRRDRIREHFTNAHGIFHPASADVDATRVVCALPPICPLCPEIVSSWDDFFRHIKEHCVIRSGSGNSSINGDRPRPGGNGGGNGGRNHGPSSAEPSNANKQSQSSTGNQASNQQSHYAGGTSYPSSSSGAFMSRGNARPYSISQSASDSQFNLGHGQRANRVRDEPFMDDKSHDPVGPRAHHPGEASRQLKPPQPRENPKSSRVDQSTQKRKRPRKQIEPREQIEPSPRRCKRCNHDLANCHECSGITGSVRCHKCSDPPRSASQAGAPSGMSVQTRPVPPSIDMNLSPEYLDALGSFGLPPNMPTQPSYYPHNEFMWQLGMETRPQSFDDMTSTFEDDLPPGSHFIGVARIAESHEPLNGLGSPVSECDTMLLRSIGLGPVKRQIKQLKPQDLVDFTQGAYEDPILRHKGFSNLLTAPKPSQCQCSCVTMPVVKHKAHGRLQLSPNERVEMTFKMSPAHESSHPLRTRVQVFVKLFKIRASVAQSSSKQKQRTRSITSGIKSKEDTESDTDSEQDISPTSPSGSELTPMFYWTEEVHDWSFSFDLTWAVLKLAQWTSDTDTDTCQKLLLADPGHILDLISMYIMYRFKIFWCFAERDWLNLLLRF